MAYYELFRKEMLKMKIKIIDLLNKITNGEKSINVETKYDSDDWVKDDFLLNLYIEFEHKNNYEIVKFLNDYVEILEEPKKIEKIARCDDIKMTHYGELHKPTENEEILRIKVNELIDEINNLKEK